MTTSPRRGRPVRPIAYLLMWVAAALPSSNLIGMLAYFLPGVVLFELGYFAYRRRLPRRDESGSSTAAADAPTEQEIRAFVGPNAHYYLKSWRPALSGEGGPTGFNWGAFFFLGLWLGYRKMYTAAFILLGLLLVETALEPVIFVRALDASDTSDRHWAVVGIIAGILTGTFANGWYLAHARRVIGEVRALGLSEADHLNVLAVRGGGNPSVFVGLFLLYMLTGVVIVMIQEAVFGVG